MKIYILSLILLILGCTERKDIEEIENTKLNEELARDLVSLSVKCVDQKYPYKIGYRFSDESWIKPHYEITPSFYGCWDWHSAVHGHWAMVKVLKDFPDISERDIILSKLDKNLYSKNLKKELDFFNNHHNIKWYWVKAHDGNFGNEKADMLANKAIDLKISNL